MSDSEDKLPDPPIDHEETEWGSTIEEVTETNQKENEKEKEKEPESSIKVIYQFPWTEDVPTSQAEYSKIQKIHRGNLDSVHHGNLFDRKVRKMEEYSSSTQDVMRNTDPLRYNQAEVLESIRHMGDGQHWGGRELKAPPEFESIECRICRSKSGEFMRSQDFIICRECKTSIAELPLWALNLIRK